MLQLDARTLQTPCNFSAFDFVLLPNGQEIMAINRERMEEGDRVFEVARVTCHTRPFSAVHAAKAVLVG